MITGIIIGAIFALLLLLAISIRRRLKAMEENINHAMWQIGVQFSSRFDALAALLHLAKKYSIRETQPLAEAILSGRYAITATSTPDDVQKQWAVLSEILSQIFEIAEQYPQLKADAAYEKCCTALESYEKMIRTSCLIYNDSVSKFNRELHLFPASLLGRICGFQQKAYLEETPPQEPFFSSAIDD